MTKLLFISGMASLCAISVMAQLLILSDWGIGTILEHPGWSTSREAMWIDPTGRNCSVAVPFGDGTYPWNVGGTSLQFSDGAQWDIFINESTNDGKFAGFADSKEHQPLYCYANRGHNTGKAQDASDSDCWSAFICNSTGPGPNGNSNGPIGGQGGIPGQDNPDQDQGRRDNDQFPSEQGQFPTRPYQDEFSSEDGPISGGLGQSQPPPDMGQPFGRPDLISPWSLCPQCPRCRACPQCPQPYPPWEPYPRRPDPCPTCPTCRPCRPCPRTPPNWVPFHEGPGLCPACPECPECPTCPRIPANWFPFPGGPSICPICPTCPPCPVCPRLPPDWPPFPGRPDPVQPSTEGGLSPGRPRLVPTLGRDASNGGNVGAGSSSNGHNLSGSGDNLSGNANPVSNADPGAGENSSSSKPLRSDSKVTPGGVGPNTGNGLQSLGSGPGSGSDGTGSTPGVQCSLKVGIKVNSSQVELTGTWLNILSKVNMDPNGNCDSAPIQQTDGSSISFTCWGFTLCGSNDSPASLVLMSVLGHLSNNPTFFGGQPGQMVSYTDGRVRVPKSMTLEVRDAQEGECLGFFSYEVNTNRLVGGQCIVCDSNTFDATWASAIESALEPVAGNVVTVSECVPDQNCAIEV